MGFDGDPICIDFRAAAESLLDLALDPAGRDTRLDLDRIGAPLQPFPPPHSAFGRGALIVPLDLAFERDPAVADEDLDLLGDDRQPALYWRDRITGAFRTRPLVEGRQTNLNVVGHAEHAGHSLCRRLRLELVGIAPRKP